MLKKKKRNIYSRYLFTIIFVLTLMWIIAIGNEKNIIISDNVNSVKSIEVAHFVYKYNNIANELTPKFVNNMAEAKIVGEKNPIYFMGTLTGYGPDCEGCIGKVYCAPWPNVENGNIYYEDKVYGKVRIVAADYAIPCGSIIQISNYRFVDEDIIAIVLDRGRDIVGNTMDLLHNSERETKIIGRQYNIKFEVKRWGW